MAELELNKLDERIIQLADHMSPEEISRELGGALSAAHVAARAKQLLKSRDWLTASEQDEIVTWKMRRILSELEKRHLDYDGAKVQLGLLKAIGERLDKRRAATLEEISSLHNNQAQIMYEAIRVMIEKAALGDEGRRAVQAALPEAVYVLSARNMGSEIEA
jgi:hypothetical protein